VNQIFKSELYLFNVLSVDNAYRTNVCFQGIINLIHWIFEFDFFKVLNVVNNNRVKTDLNH